MDVQAVFVTVVIRAPHGGAQRVVGDDVAPVLGQLAQQSQLGGREGKGAAVRQGDEGVVQIDAAPAQPQSIALCAGQLGPVGPLQNVLHPQQKLLHQEGLCQVVVRAKAQPEQPVGVGVPGREEQRGHIRFGPQGPEQRKAVPVRQVDVQNHQLRLLGGKAGSCRRAALRRADMAVPGILQLLAQQPQQVGVVVHEEKSGVIDGGHSVNPLRRFAPALPRGEPLAGILPGRALSFALTITHFVPRKGECPKI